MLVTQKQSQSLAISFDKPLSIDSNDTRGNSALKLAVCGENASSRKDSCLSLACFNLVSKSNKVSV